LDEFLRGTVGFLPSRAARDAFLALNGLYLKPLEAGATTDDHHVQQLQCYEKVNRVLMLNDGKLAADGELGSICEQYIRAMG
jgi:hypothetical protein